MTFSLGERVYSVDMNCTKVTDITKPEKGSFKAKVLVRL